MGGANSPHHGFVYVLTHHAHDRLSSSVGDLPLVTDVIQAAPERSKASARGKGVRIGSGAATI